MTDTVKRCAYCLESPPQIAEAFIGTPEDNAATDLWAYLCVPDMERFNGLPLPSDARAEFIETVTLHIREAAAGTTPDPHWTLEEIQPPLLYDEVLALFGPELLTEAVAQAWQELHWGQYEFLRRFPPTQAPAPRPGDEPPKDDEPGVTIHTLPSVEVIMRVPQNLIARLQGEVREPRLGLRRVYGESLQHAARRIAEDLADSLDVTACRVLTYGEGAEPPAYPELYATCACPWAGVPGSDQPPGPDAVENLELMTRAYTERTGRKPTRLTLSTTDLRDFAATESCGRWWASAYGGTPHDMSLVPQFIKQITYVEEIVVTDRTYRRALPSGEVRQEPVLPRGTVLFDRREDDKAGADGRLLYFAPPFGGIFLDPITRRSVTFGYGVAGYFDLRRRALPAQVDAHGLLRALPLQLRPASAVMQVAAARRAQ